jgi:uncharacterized protein YkwD
MVHQRFASAVLAAALLGPAFAPAQTYHPLPNPATYTAHATVTDGFARLLALHNAERARSGLPPLTFDPWLVNGAQAWANKQAAYRLIGHDLPCLGFAENCGQLQRSQDEIHNCWMSSPGHRRNVLDPNHRWVGFAMANGPGGPYWVARYR